MLKASLKKASISPNGKKQIENNNFLSPAHSLFSDSTKENNTHPFFGCQKNPLLRDKKPLCLLKDIFQARQAVKTLDFLSQLI
ncbi:MAG: hypothetical protein NY202_05330 [Mollicutes bacterium UO1]